MCSSVLLRQGPLPVENLANPTIDTLRSTTWTAAIMTRCGRGVSEAFHVKRLHPKGSTIIREFFLSSSSVLPQKSTLHSSSQS